MNCLFRLLIILSVLLILSIPASSQSAWHWQNPIPQGNSLEAIASAGGGIAVAVGNKGTIIRTTNAGSDWSVLTPYSNDALWDVAFRSGVGIIVGDRVLLRSTDNGTTWNPFPGFLNAYLKAVTFVDSMTIMAAGVFGEFMRSTNAGVTWDTLSIGGVGTILNDLSFANPQIGMAVGNSGLVVHTTDGGASWVNQQTITAFPLYAVAMLDSMTAVCGGPLGKIFRTSNGGTTWDPASMPSTASIQDFFFVDGQQGFAAGSLSGRSMVLRTTNAGINWSETDVDTSIMSPRGLTFLDATTGIAVGFGGKLFRTMDGGSSWNVLLTTLEEALWTIRFFSPTTGLAAGSGGVIARTTDGGLSWDKQTFGIQRGYWRSIGISKPDMAMVVGDSGRAMLSTNAGVSWNPRTTGTSNSLWGISFRSPGNAVAVGSGGTIRVSSDSGQTWSPCSSGTSELLESVTFATNDSGWAVGTSGTILATTDGGVSWIPQTSNTGNSLHSVFFFDRFTGLVAGDNATIRRTTNSGVNWSSAYAPTTVYLNGFGFYDSTVGFTVGASGMVLRTTNGGVFWNQDPSPANMDLYDVASPGPDIGIAVGLAGGILRRASPLVSVQDGAEQRSVPGQLALYQNYPNPFNPTTTIEFDLPGGGEVSLKLYDMLGQEIRTLVHGILQAGFHRYSVDAEGLPTGVYVYRLIAGETMRSGRMVLVK